MLLAFLVGAHGGKRCCVLLAHNPAQHSQRTKWRACIKYLLFFHMNIASQHLAYSIRCFLNFKKFQGEYCYWAKLSLHLSLGEKEFARNSVATCTVARFWY